MSERMRRARFIVYTGLSSQGAKLNNKKMSPYPPKEK